MHNNRSTSCIIFLILSVIGQLTAQENIRFERITPNEGLSQSDVRCMVQGKFGFLWIGTRDGLNKYDGKTFTRYIRKKGDTTSLYFNQIFDLELDAHENIWIASRGGISRYHYDTNSFSNYFVKSSNLTYDGEINDILSVNDSTILCATNEGLYSFDSSTQNFYADPKYAQFATLQILKIGLSKQFGEWIGTREGLYVRRNDAGQWIKVLAGKAVRHLNFEDGHVLVSTEQGLFKYYSNGEIEEVIVPGGFTSITETLRTKRGDLWIACDRIVVLANDDKTARNTFSHERGNEHSLSENRARTFLQTSDGTIWIGTNGYGLNKFNPEVLLFSYLSEFTSLKLSNSYISTIYTNDDNTLLIGTTRGLNILDLKAQRVTYQFTDQEMILIFKIKADKKGGVWISTSLGLFQYLNKKLILRNSDHRAIPDFVDWDMETLLLTTRTNGLFLFDKKSFKTKPFIAADQLPEEVFTVLIHQNLVWVGCKDGLRVFDKTGKLKRHFKSDWNDPFSLHSSYIKSLMVDHLDQLWIGTWGGGLSRYNASDNTFTTFDINNGLPNNVVYGILEDELGTLWVSTNFGIAAFDVREKVFKNFDFTDGLQGNEFNTGAYFKSIYGKMYFGGTNGLNYFNPESTLTAVQHMNQVLITGIVINDEEADAFRGKANVHAIETDWMKNNINIEFTVIDFRHPIKNYFQYSIDDTDWYSLGTQRNIELINLRPGDHLLKIRTGNSESGLSPHVTSLNIKIKAPFWRQPVGIVTGILLLLVSGFILFRLRLLRIKRMNSELQRLVAEQTQEIHFQNNEILAQNEELVSQAEQLSGQNSLLEEQKEKLVELTNELEQRINDRVIQVQGLNHDLAEQNLQLQQLYFIILHNLNIPFGKIKNYCEAVKLKKKPELVPEEVMTAIEDLDDAMEQLKEVSKFQNLSKDTFEPISLSVVLDKVLAILAEKITAAHAKISIEAFEKNEINGIKTLVQSIFYLLIKNGIENTIALHPILAISCKKMNGKVRITFIDNKPEKGLRNTLDRVFRLDKRYSIKDGMVGSDLYFVKKQVDALGGEISIETSATGSIFVIEFPEVAELAGR